MFPKRFIAGVFLAAVTLTPAAGAPARPSDVVQSPTPAKPAPKVIQIVIDNVAFAAVKQTVRVGDIIEWVNKDVFDHTATAKNNKDFDVALPAGKTARVTMKKAGVVEYYCRLHPNMTGTMTIRP
jgi:plastocyanin